MPTTLDFPFQLGDPLTHRGVVIAPLFPTRDPGCAYVTLDVALPQGLAITETGPDGTVPELAVHNPLPMNVLLYDGEELVGAKQNRILNVTVLLGAGSAHRIPVSCVEQGRWSARTAAMGSAGHFSHAHLRRRKAEALAAMPLAPGIAQREVWNEVADKAVRMNVPSPTQANSDTFRAHEAGLAELEPLFPLEPGQCGALLALGDSLCLDWVSRPDAFARLWPKLRRGYLLDALEALDGAPAPAETVAAFARAVGAAGVARQPSVGLGEDVRLRGAGVIGSGLELDGELLQLSAFTSSDGGERAFGRIARPSRRR
jgi:ARG and Rhodanese-Phosphatase-superfamily-associated Protein domain